ncbi:MAG: HIT domain-containing protein [Gemmataceae bacterium]|nr:HIT domain-containing protein [Gemmataceae bacterium]
MNQLWAPWRLAYISTNKPEVGSGCFICMGLESAQNKDHLIVERASASVVMLNKFPYNNGHLLIAPKRHVGDLNQLTSGETLEVQQLIGRYVDKITILMSPHGFNVGINLGAAAGAGVPGHLHWHVVPRWNGDTNFMPVLTDTKVIVQSLDTLYDLLTNQTGAR